MWNPAKKNNNSDAEIIHKRHSQLFCGETRVSDSSVQHWLITGRALALKLGQLWSSRPTDLLHIWQRRDGQRCVHYHLLLSTVSTKKLMRGWASRSLIWLPNFLLGSLFWTSRFKKLKWHVWCQARVTSKNIPESHFMIVIISVRWVLKWHCAIKIKFQISLQRLHHRVTFISPAPLFISSVLAHKPVCSFDI